MPKQRKLDFHYQLKQAGSIKDLIESLGVPHAEIDLILVNGRSVDFNYIVQDEDRISVYPVFESIDISPVMLLRTQALRVSRFVLDTHLGRLAAYLRMLGFDTLYRNDYDDPTLAHISVDQQRILLTCDKQLLMRKQITHGYYVRERQPQKQLVDIVSRIDLFKSQHPFTRCMHCNGNIQPISKTTIESHLLPHTKAHYEDFWQCNDCKKIYWKGSHYQRMQRMISALDENRLA